MSWFSVLPVVATLFAEAPASVPPADPVVVPVDADQPVAAPPAPQGPTEERIHLPAPRTDGARAGQALPEAQDSDEVRAKELKKLHQQYLANHPKTEPRWYGAPAVAADVTELALLFAVVEHSQHNDQTTVLELLGISYLVSGAVVHGLHHHAGRAVGSIALRAGALVLASLGFLALSSSIKGADTHTNGAGALGILLLPLPLVAMAIDDAGLARDEVPVAVPAQAAWTPTLGIQSGLALLGIRGSF
jgi:hypothetical protein